MQCQSVPKRLEFEDLFLNSNHFEKFSITIHIINCILNINRCFFTKANSKTNCQSELVEDLYLNSNHFDKLSVTIRNQLIFTEKIKFYLAKDPISICNVSLSLSKTHLQIECNFWSTILICPNLDLTKLLFSFYSNPLFVSLLQ